MKEWILVFMWMAQPMASGPHELNICLDMAQQETRKHHFKAHCYRVRGFERRYPDMKKDYLAAIDDRVNHG